MIWEVIFFLLGAHYLADFALQNEYVATAKADPRREDWIHAITAHAYHHALAAGLVLFMLGLPFLAGALVIGLTHWLIDYGKSVKKLYGYNIDQALHISISICTGSIVTLLST